MRFDDEPIDVEFHTKDPAEHDVGPAQRIEAAPVPAGEMGDDPTVGGFSGGPARPSVRVFAFERHGCGWFVGCLVVVAVICPALLIVIERTTPHGLWLFWIVAFVLPVVGVLAVLGWIVTMLRRRSRF